MEELVKKPYRHGNVPNAMRAAARAILDEGGPKAIGLREMARRIGVSPTAAYRHFASRDDLLASVAVEGFRELSAALKSATRGPDPLLGLGRIYVEFALRQQGLFRLMFGPLLAERAKYPRLKEAASETFRILQAAQSADGDPEGDGERDAMTAWGLIHGLSSLFIDGLVSEERIPSMTDTIIMAAIAPKPASSNARTESLPWVPELVS